MFYVLSFSEWISIFYNVSFLAGIWNYISTWKFTFKISISFVVLKLRWYSEGVNFTNGISGFNQWVFLLYDFEVLKYLLICKIRKRYLNAKLYNEFINGVLERRFDNKWPKRLGILKHGSSFEHILLHRNSPKMLCANFVWNSFPGSRDFLKFMKVLLLGLYQLQLQIWRSNF